MNGKPVFFVPAKTVVNFDSGFAEKLLCSGPTFSAGSACPYSCTYCYVESQMRKQYGEGGWLSAQGVTGAHSQIVVRRSRAVELVREQLLKKPVELLQSKQTIYSSPLTDVAANMELVRETVEICKVILELTNWDIRLLSKSNLLTKVAQELAKANFPIFSTACNYPRYRVIYGVSTGTFSDRVSRAIEPDVPLVSKRIEALRWLQDNGFRTFAMVCPSLPQECYPAFARQAEASLRYDRCEHVWAEVVNLRGQSFLNTHAALVAAGLAAEAARLKEVTDDREAWEAYARATFLAHFTAMRRIGLDPGAKLRFLQYPTKATLDWWRGREDDGAVLLGKAAHAGQS